MLAILRVAFIALDLLSVIHRCAGVYTYLLVYAMPEDSLSILERADKEEVTIERFYDDVSDTLGISRAQVWSIASYEKKVKKEYFVYLLETLFDTVENQRDIVKKLRIQADQLKTDALQSQAKVLTRNILRNRQEQL